MIVMIPIFLSILACVGCTQTSHIRIVNGVDFSKLSTSLKTTLEEASEDYKLVLAGSDPKFARAPEKISTDGGTADWHGKGYVLTVKQSLAEIGAQAGFYYGPILKFDKDVIPGNDGAISSVSFYIVAEWKNLKRISR